MSNKIHVEDRAKEEVHPKEEVCPKEQMKRKELERSAFVRMVSDPEMYSPQIVNKEVSERDTQEELSSNRVQNQEDDDGTLSSAKASTNSRSVFSINRVYFARVFIVFPFPTAPALAVLGSLGLWPSS